jgi:RND superfamily putative drug exporter
LTILAVCLMVLAPLVVVGGRTGSNYSQLADIQRDRPSVVGANTLELYFPVGELGPTMALIENPTLDFRSMRGKAFIEETSRRLAALGTVAEIRSLAQPVGKPEGPPAGKSLLKRLADQVVRMAAEPRYVSVKPRQAADLNHITRIEIVLKTDPFSESSLQALEDIKATLRRSTGEGQPLEGTTRIGLAGSTSAVNDLKRVTTSDLHRMYVLVTLGVYAILVALMRRPGISLYFIATVLLGYLASLGLTDLLFHALHRGPGPWEGLDWTVGFFLFVILVAVGEDYNILFMARVIEEEPKYGLVEGTRKAVACTGGIISSCGLIMAGAFGSMLTGSLISLQELGFALGAGVLLDTFFVRTILVPAFLVLVDRAHPRHRRRDANCPKETEVLI